MTIKDKEISPEKIYNYFKERYKKDDQGNLKKHFFMKESVLEKCIKFLEILKDLEKKRLDGKERTKKLSLLSELTIELWGLMLKDALDTLDVADDHTHSDTIKGISRLKQYLVKFKEFEMLLYGSDKWYRDTIYHQLWFYFVGEYLFSDSDLNIMSQLLEKKDWYCDPSIEIVEKNDKISDEKARYALFCVIALCHDLGKPLQKIHSINNAIRDMLEEYKFLHFSPFKVEFPLTYETMLNFLVERLGQIGIPDRANDNLTNRSRLVIEKKNKKKKEYYYIKMEEYMDNQPHMRATFSTALAELNHGMLSCLLLMESFRRFKGGAPYQNWKKGKWIQKSYMTAQSILKSIAYHCIESIEITEIDLPYFWVCLVDDLIEGYRPTRAGKDFISPSICKVRIKKASLQKLHVFYEFTQKVDQNNEENTNDENNKIEIDDDVIYFFVDKLERYYYMLKINNFEFIIEVEMKKEGEKEGILMNYTYCKKKDQEKSTKLILKKKGKTCGSKKGPIEIEDLLMLDKKNRIKTIKKVFKEGKENQEKSLF